MVEVKLHDIGEGMIEGDVITYFVKAGDRVEIDQPLVEVQTDKMVAELPSPVAGIVKEILVEAGKTIAVGTTMLTIEVGDEKTVPTLEKIEEAPPGIEKVKPIHHKIKKMPVVNESDEIVIRSMMNVSMTFDHRVADGGTAVTFTNQVKQLIENPKLLIVELV
jgi:pyruvate/2-oxoglutarate dehydrogenase complex dihydrolipoamide acyltransferase (E2) component